jgi:hypothetical protein
VITKKEFLPSNFPDNKQKFWDSGRTEVEEILTLLENLGVKTRFEHLVELGAGVGRLTKYLSECSSKVTALDISLGNLNELRANLTENSNVTAKMIQKVEDLDDLETFDCFFTLITLQHNSPPIQAYILRKMMQFLKSGGIGVFQVPIYQPNYEFNVAAYLNTAMTPSEMDMHCLPLSEIIKICQHTDVEILVSEQDSRAGLNHISHTFIVRKR